MTKSPSIQHIIRDLEDVPACKFSSSEFWSCHRRSFVATQAPLIPKYSAEDTSLVIGNEAGETTVFPIPAGSRIDIDVPGLHYNRKSHLFR